MFLLKLIFVLFAGAFLLALIVAWSFFRQVRNAAKRFQQQSPQQKQTKVNGNVIIDHRSTAEKDKKIISDDEGEYIEFEE